MLHDLVDVAIACRLCGVDEREARKDRVGLARVVSSLWNFVLGRGTVLWSSTFLFAAVFIVKISVLPEAVAAGASRLVLGAIVYPYTVVCVVPEKPRLQVLEVADAMKFFSRLLIKWLRRVRVSNVTAHTHLFT